MPKGPRGEKRPADAIGLAVMIGRIATGEVEDTTAAKTTTGRGRSGGAARAAKLSPDERSAIAKKAAQARWQETADE